MKNLNKIVLIVFTSVFTFSQAQAMRWYSSSTGRWLSRDPIEEKGGLNQYAFVYNNLVNNVDGLGLEQVLIWASAYIPDSTFRFPFPNGGDPSAIFSGDGRTAPQIAGSSRAYHLLTIETDPSKIPIVRNKAGGGISTVWYTPGGGIAKLFFLSAQDATPPYATVSRVGTVTRVQIHAATSDPLVWNSPALHYDYTLVFADCSKTLKVSGSHDYYPAFDLIIDTTAGQKTLVNYVPTGIHNSPAWLPYPGRIDVDLPLQKF